MTDTKRPDLAAGSPESEAHDTPPGYPWQSPDRPSRAANVAAFLEWQRGRSRTHLDRLRALEAAGIIPDDRHWERFASAVPR